MEQQKVALSSSAETTRLRALISISVLAAITALSGCEGTMPTMGGAKGTVTGAAGGGNTEGENSKLERCDETLGTLGVHEDQAAAWWRDYYGRYPKLGSTTPVLRLMIQQSNCFVVVERGRAMNDMMR